MTHIYICPIFLLYTIPARVLDSEVFPFWAIPSSELLQSRSTRYTERRIRITPEWIVQVI